jgi:ubiquinone/menaquinone biosynthesis C-methylase UbiE
MAQDKEEKYWSKFASTFEHDQEWVVGKTAVQTLIKRLLQEDDLGEVIEFGCGTGTFTIAVAKNAKHIIATDLSDEMLEIARTKLEELKNVTVEKANCKNTSFPSERFDTVFMANLIHVIENPHEALQESHRILRNQGVLLIASVTSYGMSWFGKMRLAIRYVRKWGKPPCYFRGDLSPDALSSLVASAGFEVEEVEVIGDRMKALYLKGRKR